MSGASTRKSRHAVALTTEAHEALRRLSFASGEPMGDIASRVIAAWFADQERAEEVRLRAAQRIERMLKRETLTAGWDENPQGDVALELARRLDGAP